MEKNELNKFFRNTRRHRRFDMDAMNIRITAETASGKSTACETYAIKMLSLGGALMTGDNPHEPDSKLMLDMTLPENVRVSFTGTVTSCLAVKHEGGVLYDIGVRFGDMSEQDKIELKKLIHWLYLKDAGFTE